jgi:RNA polymerase sigma-70 factor (ECF subfamily)
MAQAHTHSASAIDQRARPFARQAASDEALIGRIAAGDRQAMQALFVRHNVRVFRFVMGKVKDRTVADDLVSEIFLEVWRNAHRFEGRAAVATWLLAIARHKAMSAQRSRRVHGELDEALAIADPSESPAVAAEIKDRDQILRACLTRLSAGHREILDLVYYQEQPIEAVARIVGIPLNTVKTRLFYARKHLAARLSEAGLDRAAL